MARMAVDAMTARFDADSPFVAYALVALGRALIATGRAADSVPHLERALRLRERSEPNQRLVAETRFVLAQALWNAGGVRAQAHQLATAARDFYAKDTMLAKQAAEVQRWLGEHTLPASRH
jgi:hypothetical protein